MQINGDDLDISSQFADYSLVTDFEHDVNSLEHILKSEFSIPDLNRIWERKSSRIIINETAYRVGFVTNGNIDLSRDWYRPKSGFCDVIAEETDERALDQAYNICKWLGLSACFFIVSYPPAISNYSASRDTNGLALSIQQGLSTLLLALTNVGSYQKRAVSIDRASLVIPASTPCIAFTINEALKDHEALEIQDLYVIGYAMPSYLPGHCRRLRMESQTMKFKTAKNCDTAKNFVKLFYSRIQGIDAYASNNIAAADCSVDAVYTWIWNPQSTRVGEAIETCFETNDQSERKTPESSVLQRLEGGYPGITSLFKDSIDTYSPIKSIQISANWVNLEGNWVGESILDPLTMNCHWKMSIIWESLFEKKSTNQIYLSEILRYIIASYIHAQTLGGLIMMSEMGNAYHTTTLTQSTHNGYDDITKRASLSASPLHASIRDTVEELGKYTSSKKAHVINKDIDEAIEMIWGVSDEEIEMNDQFKNNSKISDKKSSMSHDDSSELEDNELEFKNVLEHLKTSSSEMFESNQAKTESKVPNYWVGGGLSDKGGCPLGRIVSLLALQMGRLLVVHKSLRAASMVWSNFTKQIRMCYDQSTYIPNMNPIESLEGRVMHEFYRTNQTNRIAAKWRSHLEAGNDSTLKTKAMPEPDHRLSLLFQKLQMINCCIEQSLKLGKVEIQEDRPPTLILQNIPPVTSDILEQQKQLDLKMKNRMKSVSDRSSKDSEISVENSRDGWIVEHRRRLRVLIIDMQDYINYYNEPTVSSSDHRNKNLIDFLRWYSPSLESIYGNDGSIDEELRVNKSDLDWAWKTAYENFSNTLFDPHTEAEYALHYLDTATPSMVLSQMLLSIFSISACIFDEIKKSTEGRLVPVKQCIVEAQKAIVKASTELEELNNDAEPAGILIQGKLVQGTSQTALMACSTVVETLEKAEKMVTKARLLLSLFPANEELINSVLVHTSNEFFPVSESDRQSLMRLIRQKSAISNEKNEDNQSFAEGLTNDSHVSTNNETIIFPPVSRQYVVTVPNLEDRSSRLYAYISGRVQRIALTLLEP